MSKLSLFTFALAVGAANPLAAAGQSRIFAIRYETTSLTLPGVSRSFRGSSDAAAENGNSRVFAGIHFPHAVRDGHLQGRSIGRAVGKLLQSVRKAPDNY